MQAVWVGFDQISGKGVSMSFILKFIGYLALTVVPMAIPIGILLSSIMALGDFAENYEFAAIKSAGISLKRFILPIALLTVLLSGINFLFLNYVFPHATLKQKNMFNNVKKKQPALALIPGTFNTEIPGYIIFFDEKYGEDNNFLKNVQISDLSARNGKIKVITAKEAEITTEEGSKYMEFILKDGHFNEEYSHRGKKRDARIKMPASKATFEKYTINIDVSSFSDEGIEDIKNDNDRQMLSLSQIKSRSDTVNATYVNNIQDRASRFYLTSGAKYLHSYPDSIINKNLQNTIIDNFELAQKITVIDNALMTIDRQLKNVETETPRFKRERKYLNQYDHEYHNRIAFSFACLVLFFIGAPLGSIIRKGGFGLPMVMAIIIFVIYFFISTLGKNLAEESAVTPIVGGWISTAILLPFGILLTRRAAKDMGLFNIDTFFDSIKKFFKRSKQKQKT
jgi:lipopolysaccharide export system permease protein